VNENVLSEVQWRSLSETGVIRQSGLGAVPQKVKFWDGRVFFVRRGAESQGADTGLGSRNMF
jgi:hypothetical protein